MEQIISKYMDRIHNHCSRIVNNEDTGADLAQEVCIKFFLNYDKIDTTKYDFSSWLNQVTVNSCIDHFRKNKRRVQSESLSYQQNEGVSHEWKEREIPDDRHNPENFMLNQEMSEIINQAMESLPEKLRTPIILREIEGYTYAEIGEKLQCSSGTVKSRMHHARRHLRTMLAPYL